MLLWHLQLDFPIYRQQLSVPSGLGEPSTIDKEAFSGCQAVGAHSAREDCMELILSISQVLCVESSLARGGRKGTANVDISDWNWQLRLGIHESKSSFAFHVYSAMNDVQRRVNGRFDTNLVFAPGQGLTRSPNRPSISRLTYKSV